MRKKVNSKCYMCERRHPACQDKCPDYLAWKANLDATNAKIKDEKKKFEDTVAALGAADEIIIPVELEGFSLHGAGEIRSQVANMRTVNPRLRIAGALITKRRGTRIQEAAEQALRVSGIPAFEAAIPLRASVPASMSNLNASKTLMGYAPKDAATKAYHDFTREYLSKGGAVNG